MSNGNIMSSQTYLSKRNIPLLYIARPPTKPVITMENYTKWYDIYIVHSDGSVEVVSPELIEEVKDECSDKEYTCLQYDHLYHPYLLQRIAIKLNAFLDERALEVAAGRWYFESDQPLGPPNFDI